MASIVDVAKYILHAKGECTTMKLQKLCYYAQAWTLVWDEVPLFDEDFEAWANGPVAPVLFAMHKGEFAVRDGDLGDYDDAALDANQRENVDIVLREYWPLSAFQLSAMSHREDPWVDARNGLPSGAKCTARIYKPEMQEYYARLLYDEDEES